MGAKVSASLRLRSVDGAWFLLSFKLSFTCCCLGWLDGSKRPKAGCYSGCFAMSLLDSCGTRGSWERKSRGKWQETTRRMRAGFCSRPVPTRRGETVARNEDDTGATGCCGAVTATRPRRHGQESTRLHRERRICLCAHTGCRDYGLGRLSSGLRLVPRLDAWHA
ncbi:hypothetical protein C8R46DRAFT_1064751 [Mycena filopes]|nr:hypothetical protein C8R46DRAFT_1064751 [Mycena filopes]